jgi:ergothioneine biosynthesis protein EgtB
MADDGYARPELWSAEGWEWRCREAAEAPLHWERDGEGGWLGRCFDRLEPVDSGRPLCHVSAHEAGAHARWAGARLPTEFEWEMAAAGTPIAGNLAESGRFHVAAAAADGGPLRQLWGDVWEWTRSQYSPYPGYVPAAGALGEYNGKFMCNQFVLRGGSCATSRTHIRASYRNFFPPDATWQFTGLRLARDAR